MTKRQSPSSSSQGCLAPCPSLGPSWCLLLQDAFLSQSISRRPVARGPLGLFMPFAHVSQSVTIRDPGWLVLSPQWTRSSPGTETTSALITPLLSAEPGMAPGTQQVHGKYVE